MDTAFIMKRKSPQSAYFHFCARLPRKKENIIQFAVTNWHPFDAENSREYPYHASEYVLGSFHRIQCPAHDPHMNRRASPICTYAGSIPPGASITLSLSFLPGTSTASWRYPASWQLRPPASTALCVPKTS